MHERDDSSGASSVSSCQAVDQHWLSQEDLRTAPIISIIENGENMINYDYKFINNQHRLSHKDLKTGSIINTIVIMNKQRNCDCDHIHKQPAQTLSS